MNILANADPKVNIGGTEYNRIPGVILVSDGAAGDMSLNSNWWNLSHSDTNYRGALASNANRVAIWFAPVLEASYMKNVVAANYGADDCYIATVGFDLSSAGSNERAVANVVLNPSEYVAADGTVTANPSAGLAASARDAFKTAYTNLLVNHTSATLYRATGTPFTFNYPTGDAAQYMPADFKYNDTYVDVDNAADLASHLSETISLIAESAYTPTNSTDMTGEASGYITFTDTLGDLMEVKYFDSILWVDHDPSSPTYGVETEYTNVSKSTSGKVDTYVFDASVHSSWYYDYEDTNLNRIIITVDKSGARELVTIKIPPALLPMVDYKVSKSGGVVTSVTRNEETRPIKINYVVGPKEGVVGYLTGQSGGSSLPAALKAQADAYAANAANTVTTASGASGIALYANAWSGSDESVVASASFDINPLNSYYSFVARTLLYSDSECTVPATSFSAGTTYYYPHDVYVVGKSGSEADRVVKSPVSSLTAADVELVGGQLYVKAGVSKDLPADVNKDPNTTGTRTYQLHSRWADGNALLQRQGNDGRLAVEVPGKLQLDKTIVLDEALQNSGVAINEDAMSAKEFTFTLTFLKPGSNSEQLEGSYVYTVTNPGKADRTGTVASGGTVALTEDDTLLVAGLPVGCTYTIAETSIPQGYSVQSSTTTYGSTTVAGSGDDGSVSGTIASGATSTAEFTNEYAMIGEGSASIQTRPHVKKTIEGREFADTDHFLVTIAPYASNPAPAVADPALLDINTTTGTRIDNHSYDASFNSLTFSAPGTYLFRIAEQNNAIPGITYSQSVYAYRVVVVDNGDGTMSIDPNTGISMEKVIGIDGSSVDEGDPDRIVQPTEIIVDGQPITIREAAFTNTYNLEEAVISTAGIKSYTDKSGVKPLTANMFQFEIRPSFYNANGDVLPQATVDAVPMPAGTEDTRYTDAESGLQYRKKGTFNSSSGDFGFGDIRYGANDIGKTYRYVVQEIVPDNALASGMRSYVNRTDASDVIQTTDDHGDLWHDGDKIYDLKTVEYQGMTYDCSRHEVVVDVRQETTEGIDHIVADVTFQTTESEGAGEVTITNTYEPTPVETDENDKTISIIKQLVGRELLDGETFTFNLVPVGANAINAVANGAIVMPEGGATVSVDALDAQGMAEACFDGIVFKRAGTFTFSISEAAGSAVATEYDAHSCVVMVTVADNGDGTLGISDISYTGSQTFTNTYNPDEVHYGALGALQIRKMVVGRAMVAEKYAFTVEAADDNARAKTPEALTVRNAAAAADGVESGTQALTGLVFTRDDIGKTFTYTVTEVVPDGATENPDGTFSFEGITYASDGKRVQTVSFEVSDDGQNNLTVTATCGDETVVSNAETAYPLAVHFVNSYSYEPLIYHTTTYYKVVQGREWREGDEFSFTIASSEGAPMPQIDGHDNTTAHVAYGDQTGDTATFTFGDAVFTHPGTYTYTITEDGPDSVNGLAKDKNVHAIQVIVTDNGDGTLSGRTPATNVERTFTNVYHASMDFTTDETGSVVDASKTLLGRSIRDREFMIDVTAIDVLDDEGAPVDGYASAEETAARFNQRITEVVPIAKPTRGGSLTSTAVPGIVFDEHDAGTTYVFEIREFVPSDAEEAELDGETYPMREGVYYNTNGIDHYRAEVKDEDNGDGTLKVTTTLIAHDADHRPIGEPQVTVNDRTPAETAPAAQFHNTYVAEGVANVYATKDLEGRDWLATDSFEFVLEPMKLVEGALVEDSGTRSELPTYNIVATSTTDPVGSSGAQHQAAHNGVNGWQLNYNVGMLTQDSDDAMRGDFYYRIREVGADGQPGSGGTAHGIAYSATPRYIHVRVQDLGNGELTTEVDQVSADAPNTDLGFTPIFTNRYTATGSYQLAVTKVLTGRAWTDRDSYSFKLSKLRESYPDPTGDTTVTITQDTEGHTANFGTITFPAPGIYNYLIEELPGSIAGVEYDANNQRRVRFTVSDKGDGALNIDSVVYYTDTAYLEPQTDQDSAVFTNAYKASSGLIDTGDDGTGTGIFTTIKEMTGRPFREGGAITFRIAAPAGAPAPSEPVVIVAPENTGMWELEFDFGTIEFTEEHLALSPMVYTITEDPGTTDGITYDTHEEKVQIALVDNGDGTLSVTATPLNTGTGDDTPDDVRFINDYKATGSAEVNAIKDFSGREGGWLSSDSFGFRLTPVKLEGGRYVEYQADEPLPPMPASTAATATKNNSKVAAGQYLAAPAWTINLESSKDRQDLAYDSQLGHLAADYYYRIDELVPATKPVGVTYDTEPRYVHVHAEDDRHGHIETAVYYDESRPGDSTTAQRTAPIFENVYESPTASLRVTKTWNDSDNRDGKRTDVIVHLFRQTPTGLVQVEVPALTLATGAAHNQNMSGTWNDLPIYEGDGATKIVYVVREEAIGGYTPTVSPSTIQLSDGSNAVGITNAYTPAVTSVKVDKNWDDNNNQAGLRPASVEVRLLANGDPAADANGGQIAPATLNEQGGWTYTFTNLPAMRDGAAIDYTVVETALDTFRGYNSPVITGCAGKGYTITNTRPTTYVDVTATKVWDDNNNSDGLRPNFVTFQLYKQIGTGQKQAVSGTTLTVTGLDSQNTWTGTLKNLLRYEQGQRVTYSFDELSVPTGYTKTVSDDGLTITNTHTEATGTVRVVKYWDDNSDQDHVRPTDADFAAALTLYADDAAVTGVTPTVSSTGNNTTVTWTGLNVYGRSGTKIKYRVAEGAISDYTLVSNSGEVELSQGGTATINVRNHHDTNTKSVHFTKIWNDGSNQDSTRPDAQDFLDSVELYDQYGRKIDRTGVNKTVDDSDPNRWTVTWDGLGEHIPEGQHIGEEAIYHAVETQITGYDAPVYDNSSSTHSELTDGVYDGGTVTNTHTTATVTLRGTKTWNDANDAYGTRPASITITLKDGDTVVDTAAVEADTDGTWTYEFENLPEFRNGERIAYTVEEAHVNGYTTTYGTPSFDDSTNTWTANVSNTLETTSISGIKIWNDNANAKGLRPGSVDLKVMNGTTELTRVNVTGGSTDASWSYAVAGLPRYNADGSNAVYNVVEVPVPEYAATTVFGTNVVNSLLTHDITGTKVWLDGGKVHDNTTEVPLAVYRSTNGVDWEAQPLPEHRYHIDWFGSNYTISGLADTDASGNRFFYKVVETRCPAGYDISYSNTGATLPDLTDGASSGGTIVNTIQQGDQTIRLVAEKTIEGREFQDGDSFTFNIDAAQGTPMPEKEDQQVSSVTIEPTSGTTAEVDFGTITIPANAVPDNDQGVTYTYTISEQADPALAAKGVTADTTPDVVTVNAKKVNGVIVLTVTPGQAPYAAFSNSYQASPIATSDADSNTIKASKILKGRDWQQGDSFEFAIEAVTDGAPMPAADAVTVRDTAPASFGPMTFTAPGVYVYRLTEKQPTGASGTGIAYSTEAFYAAVIVTDNNDGTLAAETRYYADAELRSELVGAQSAAFTNVYSITGGSVSGVLKATKKLDGRNFESGDSFGFAITAADGTPMPANTRVALSGISGTDSAQVDFGAVAYALEDLGGEKSRVFEYAIVETAGNQGGIAYDEQAKNLFVKVTDNGDGTMTVEYSTDGAAFAAAEGFAWPVIGNSYTATGSFAPEVTKAISGASAEGMTFSFELRDAEGKLVGAAAVKGAGTATFPAIEYTLADLAKSPYTYTISEKLPEGVTGQSPTKDGVTYDTHEVTLTVTLADDGRGGVTATGSYEGDTTFTNTISGDGTSVTVAKKWDDADDQDGIRPDSVTVNLLANGQPARGANDEAVALVLDEANNFKDSFDGLPTYDASGDPIAYTVEEKAVDGYTPAVTGSGTAADPYVIANSHKPATYGDPDDPSDPEDPTDPGYTGIRATKVWSDGGADASTHPAVTLTLTGRAANGATVYTGEPQTIPAGATGDSLTVGWRGAPVKHAGEEVVYQVEEVPVDGYVAMVAGSPADGFTVTNSTETTSVSGSKIWLDRGNALGLRPASVTLKVKNGAAEVAQVSVTGGSTDLVWSYAVDGLPRYGADGSEIRYSVEEEPVANYTASYIARTIVVNEPVFATLTGTKVWADGGKVHDNGAEVELQVWRSVDGGRTWEADPVDPAGYHVDWEGGAYTVTGLAPKDAEGRTYTYAATEKTVPAGYAVSYSDSSGKAVNGGTITNTFDSGSVELGLVAKKTIEGREFQAGDEFTFAVSSTNDNAPMPAQASVTIEPASGTEADVDFGIIRFEEPGTYTYTIAEAAGSLPGVTYDSTAKTVTVTVVREDGVLSLASEPASAPYATFSNRYAADPLVVDPDAPSPQPGTQDCAITVAKVLQGRDFRDGDSFEFAIEAVTDGAPMPTQATISVSDGTPAHFGAMTFTTPGTFVYKLSETKGSDPAISYSTEEYWAVIEVSDDGYGSMSAERRYYKDAGLKSEILGADRVSFTNVYGGDDSSIDAPIQAVKTLDTRDFTEGDKFSFAITAPDGTPMPTRQTVTIEPTEGKSYAIDFGTAHYTLADAGKTYTYTVVEAAGNQGGITYEEGMAAIAVKIVDNGDGTIHAEYSVNGGEFALATAEGFAWPSLDNRYTASGSFTPQVKKTVVGASLAPEQFEFELKDSEGKLVSAAKNDSAGDVAFPAIDYTLADLAKSPYTYTISEKLPEGVTAQSPTKDGVTYDTHEVTLTVTLADDGRGGVTATGSYTGSTIFNNKVAGSGTNVTVVKKWNDANDQDGLRPDSIAVTLTSTDGSVVKTATLKAEDNWVYTFLDLPIYDSTGKELTYTVDETQVPEGYEKTISADGLTITNTHVPEQVGADKPLDPSDPGSPIVKAVSATKVWNDNEDDERHIVGGTNSNNGRATWSNRSDVTMRLVGTVDGQTVYCSEPQTIPADAKGDALTVTWTGVPAKHAGKTISYTVLEDTVFGYTTTVAGNPADGFVVTNSKSDTAPTAVTVTKEWNDADNQDGIRPTSVTVNLIQKVGEGSSATTSVFDTAELNAEGDWSHTWSDLPHDARGLPVTYAVTEETPDGYTAYVVASETPGTFKVVNTHVPETYGTPDGPTDPADPGFDGIKATKIWADNDNDAGSRPGYVVFHLVGKVGDQTVYSDSRVVYGDKLSVGWTGVPKSHGGNPITYTVEEDAIGDCYTTSSTAGDIESGFTITNTYNADYGIKAVKSWEGADASPVEVTLHLMKRVEGYGDIEVQSATIPTGAAGDKLKVDFGTHPKVEHGLPVTYYVVEDEVEGWQPVMGSAEVDEDGGTVTLPIVNKPYTPPVAPARQFVTYVDHLASPDSQVLLYQEVPEGGSEPPAPANPDHAADKYQFATWDKNVSTITDDDGNPTAILTTYVAQFQDLSKLEKTVTYVNGQAPDGQQLVKSEKTTDPSKVAPPEEKPAAENMTFTGWAGPVEDAAGNLVYAARFEADCRNTPSKHCHIDPPVRKEIVGNPTTSPTFTFVLESVTPGAPMPAGSEGNKKTLSFAGAGEVEFGWIEFTEPGTYEYKIYEVQNAPENWKYDAAEYGMKVMVKEEESGQLSVERTLMSKDGTVVEGMTTAVITNTFTGTNPDDDNGGSSSGGSGSSGSGSSSNGSSGGSGSGTSGSGSGGSGTSGGGAGGTGGTGYAGYASASGKTPVASSVKTPVTGDETPLAVLGVMVGVSMAVMLVSAVRRRRS